MCWICELEFEERMGSEGPISILTEEEENE